jgi:hypothetical protein
MHFARLPAAFAGAAIMLALGAGQAGATTSPFLGEVNQAATVSLGVNSNGSDGDNDRWRGAPRTLNATVHAVAVSTDGTTTLTGDSHVQATWASANRGAVTFDPHQFIGSGDNDQPVDLQTSFENQGGQIPDWGYDFSVDHDGSFTLNSDIFGSGLDPAGFGGWTLAFFDDSQTPQTFVLNQFLEVGVHQRGQIVFDLAAGHEYLFELFNSEHFEENQVSPFRDTEERARFDWTISGEDNRAAGGVPEPSTWALSILGFGLAGAAMRRRGRAAAAG